MSAPPTPQAMADELDALAESWHNPKNRAGLMLVDPDDVALLRDAAKLLRSVPSEAQKIEALNEAAECGLYIADGRDEWGMPDWSSAKRAAHFARAAMRLLGIDPEAP